MNALSDLSDRTMTPPQVARRWGVNVEKVLHFVRSGELAAFNIATHVGGRPRYRIRLADVAAFEQRRAAVPVRQVARRQPRPPATNLRRFI